ncbi:Protein CBG05389 [Caenorhabditis briggsae]|uniref:Protein CBG05389 n=1 Tax=Caenorhabditis briggsae TaxID=6238 RepID=A8WZR6_CAEBR|nr:Protein CBG05389 [Caenorhabditis briggsae]CAP25876.1 Protein CBG05389 [Caenorhabditis briggsae]
MSAPNEPQSFTDPAYWKNFFAKRKSPFEWYGDYNSLSKVIDKYLKPSDSFLQLGCGNSELATQLYDNGFHNIHSIDVEPSVIADQIRKNKERPGMLFSTGDAANLTMADGSHTVVIDKGTLDALLPPSASEADKATVTKMFDEVHRVLASGGRYMIVTLAQPHITEFWIDHFFPLKQYILRVQKIENKASGFPMPVFCFIATKMRAPMPNPLPLEVLRSSAIRTDRIGDTDDLKDAIKAEQELSQFIYLCSKKLDVEVSIDFHGEDPALGPRYRICVVDRPEKTKIESFAAFVVPIGRDAEWLFASPKGRKALSSQCGRDRLVIVFLNRNQHYEKEMDEVKSDIGHFVGMLDARNSDTGNYEILSVGGVDVKRTISSGRSEINGGWSVEEVTVDERQCRRLVFLNTMNLIQSEAYLKISKKKQTVIDLDQLACDFHRMMIGSLALNHLQPLAKIDTRCRMAVLGLGGGLLAAYLLRNFKKARVTAVELDPEVSKIANSHFSFPHSDARVQVIIQDALVHLQEVAGKPEEEKYDVIFVDVSGTQNAALQCPPPAFLTPEALSNMKNSLKEQGMLSLNLVTRDSELGKSIKKDIAEYFPTLYTVLSCEDVNEVVVGLKAPKNSLKAVVPQKLMNTVRKDLGSHNEVVAAVSNIRLVD